MTNAQKECESCVPCKLLMLEGKANKQFNQKRKANVLLVGGIEGIGFHHTLLFETADSFFHCPINFFFTAGQLLGPPCPHLEPQLMVF